jgi:formate dehydrogenase alpha subunit
VAGLAAAFGSGAMTNSLDEIEQAPVIFIIGSNTTEQHPLVARRILRAVREKGTQLIVADPRAIDITGFASIHLQLRPGTNLALLNGMTQVILSENLHNQEFINQRTEGFEALRETLARYPLDRVEAITGVPAGDIRKAALLYAGAERASIIYCMGVTQHASGTNGVMAIANLAMVTGNLGREGTGVNPLRGQNNVQGACDMGGLPNVFSGYQQVASPEARSKMESAWKVSGLSDQPGLTLTEMMEAAHQQKLKALYIVGENPLVSDPDLHHVRESLDALELLVVQDMFLTETAQVADVVLPASSFAEKDGTFSSTDRTVQRVRKAIEPIAGCREDWKIIGEIGRLMGYEGLIYRSPEEIMKEIAAVTPAYGGISYERLEERGIPWPCPTPSHPGTPFLHKDQFSRGKGKFAPVEYIPPAEMPDDAYPLTLTTGRVLYHYHTGSMTRRSPTLTAQLNEGYIELNFDDAARLGVSGSETVRVISRRGAISLKTRITHIIPAGTVFIPFHFAEAAANVLTSGSSLDPVAKIPELKVCAVRIEKVG